MEQLNNFIKIIGEENFETRRTLRLMNPAYAIFTTVAVLFGIYLMLKSYQDGNKVQLIEAILLISVGILTILCESFHQLSKTIIFLKDNCLCNVEEYSENEHIVIADTNKTHQLLIKNFDILPAGQILACRHDYKLGDEFEVQFLNGYVIETKEGLQFEYRPKIYPKWSRNDD